MESQGSMKHIGCQWFLQILKFASKTTFINNEGSLKIDSIKKCKIGGIDIGNRN